MPWTHYVDEGHVNVHCFSIEKCETCGKDCEAPNAVGISKYDALRFGLKKLNERLPEQYYNDDLGKCSCYGCDGNAPSN